MIQIFFLVMMISFSYGGPIAFGVIIGIPPLLVWGMGRRRNYLFIFYFICISFVIGQRTVYIGGYMRIVPAEVLLCLLALTCFFIRPQYSSQKAAVPLAATMLAVFCIPAIFLSAAQRFYEHNLSVSFEYAQMMWMAIPSFFVCHRLVQRMENIQNFILLLSMGALFLSFLALAEYFHFGFIKYFGGFIVKDAAEAFDVSGFRRLGATFWGGPMVAGYLILCFPLILAYWFNSRTMIQKILVGVSLVLSFLTIYFSGHRGLWVAFSMAMGSYFLLKGIKGIFVLILLIGIGVSLMPQSAKKRMETLYGEKRDSSSVDREERAREAWEWIKQNPIVGNGWGASGLVHSDFLQLWADAGLGAMAAFLILWFQILRRLLVSLKKTRDKIFREYSFGFFASLFGVLFILSTQAWFNLAEQYAPFWVVMALAYQYPNIISRERGIMIARNQSASGRAEEHPHA